MKYNFTGLTIPQIYSIFHNMGYENTIDPKPNESEFVIALREEMLRRAVEIIKQARDER
jgi:hypothetical protein